MPRRSSGVENAFQYSSSARSSNAVEASSSNVANAVAGEAVQERLALDRGSHRLGDLDPLVVGKESRVGDHQAGDGIRVIARPAQADQAAGVVDHQHDPVEPDLAAEAFDCLDMAFEGPGRIGRRVAEAGEIRRHRSVARRRERGKQVTPHVGALWPPVYAQRRHTVRRL